MKGEYVNRQRQIQHDLGDLNVRFSKAVVEIINSFNYRRFSKLCEKIRFDFPYLNSNNSSGNLSIKTSS